MRFKTTHFERLPQALLCALALLLCPGPLARGADFYISTQADFDTYRQATFSPGDNILLERGKVFTGMFAPRGVGSPANRITISAYGTGNKPIINNHGVVHPHPTRANGDPVSAGLLLYNSEYVTVSNLEITNNNGGTQEDVQSMGIYVLGEDRGKALNQIYIQDNYIHHINGEVEGKERGGIHFYGASPTSSNATTFNDVRITNNVLNYVGGVGISTDIANADIERAHDFPGTHRANAIKNLYVAHNWIGNTGRNSLVARDTDYAVIEYNTSANSSRHSTGNSFYNFKTIGTVFQFNEAYGNTGDVGDHDRGGFDADYYSKGTVIQYNYTHGNHWFASIMKKPMTDTIIRYNLSVNDLYGAYHYGFENDSDMTDTNIYNNTHYFKEELSPELIGPRLDRTPLETVFNNNVFSSASSGTAGTNADNGTNVTYDTNVYHNITPPASEVNPLTQNPQLYSPGAEPYDIDMEFGRGVLAGYMLAGNSPYGAGGIPIANDGGLDFWGSPLSAGSTVFGAGKVGAAGMGPTATVLTGDLFPATNVANVIAATPDHPGLSGDDALTSLTQTFQVDSTFDLKTIFLGYDYDPNSLDPNEILVNLEIFEVDDVGASTLIPGTSQLVLTGLSLPELIASDVGAIVLDSALSLEETAGTAGYALRLTNGGNPGFEWLRTGSTAGSVYAFGQAYEDGVEKLGGERDFILALSDLDISLADNADFNTDGEVDGTDFLIWQRGFGNSNAQITDGDANHDKVVDSDDLVVWKNQYGTQITPASSTAVPEPSSLLVCTLAISAICLSGRFAFTA
ncbi:hypothetical protein [Adhaeretor mobilis]|uniref:Probable pectate lyase C n=1 Tax=Adhaeretor mobilis TaxID=1930276 RepID=A0A517N1B0_9BACT|nr:hypothetical protein [Adhaeretor mobilis]QDT00915.1 hypothetical protein HG15A2_42570 [Adhaeretor mobilis]